MFNLNISMPLQTDKLINAILHGLAIGLVIAGALLALGIIGL